MATTKLWLPPGRDCSRASVGPGRREIDGIGLRVTPAFVDFHTHGGAEVPCDWVASSGLPVPRLLMLRHRYLRSDRIAMKARAGQVQTLSSQTVVDG